MKPIPDGVCPDDAKWGLAFLQLAHGLVEHGAKAAIIKRYTDLPKVRVTALYKALRDEPPAPGALLQGDPRFFAIPTKHTSASWVLQGAIFLECFDRLTRIADYPIHHGWLLLHAYKSYLNQTQKIVDAVPGVRRLDINQAYALLARVSFLHPKVAKENVLQREPCVICGTNYLVVTNEEQDHQHCPVCLINQNAERLAEQSSAGGVSRNTVRIKDEKQRASA